MFGEGEHLSLEGGEEVGGRVVDLYGAAEGGAAFFGGAPQEQADGAVGEGSDVIGGFDNHGKHYINEGQFAPGSMLPKVEASIEFVTSGVNRKTIITTPYEARDAINGLSGTQIGGDH